jgi:nucleoside-diphosphate-sugar epimerase
MEGREAVNLPAIYPDAICATKKASEQICGLYTSTYEMSVPIMRLARIYGPTAHWRRNPMERMVVSAVEGMPADCLDTYEGSYLCPIHAMDCAKGISLIHLEKELKYNIYNLADGNHITYGEVANIVKEIVPNADIRLGTDKQLDMSYPFHPVNIDRIKAEGWTPEYADLKKGIKAYIDYIKHGKY